MALRTGQGVIGAERYFSPHAEDVSDRRLSRCKNSRACTGTGQLLRDLLASDIDVSLLSVKTGVFAWGEELRAALQRK